MKDLPSPLGASPTLCPPSPRPPFLLHLASMSMCTCTAQPGQGGGREFCTPTCLLCTASQDHILEVCFRMLSNTSETANLLACRIFCCSCGMQHNSASRPIGVQVLLLHLWAGGQQGLLQRLCSSMPCGARPGLLHPLQILL